MNESILRTMLAEILHEMLESHLEEDSLVKVEPTEEEEVIDEEWELGTIKATELAGHNGKTK